ncbi:MAG: prepilin-type N-terminal cleavage/methylation domain-containing protein [Cyanobacteria bacterium P01_H01_bin.26]
MSGGNLFKRRKKHSLRNSQDFQRGFTLLEVLIVLVLLGILGALSVPGWFSFLSRWQLTDAQGNLYSAIRQTQTKARNNGINWQFSIRETGTGVVEWAIHPQTEIPQIWERLGHASTDIDVANTTLDKRNGIYYIRFDYKGRLASRTRTLTITSSRTLSNKRCIVMSTVLGTMRKGQEQQQPSSSGRYCY